MSSLSALALVGFMPQDQGVHYLANECVPANPDPTALHTEWATAQALIGPAETNAGHPQISEIPAAGEAYVNGILNSPNWAHVFPANPSWQIKYIEIAPLLAFQFAVLNGTADAHSSGFSDPPTLDELLPVCIPQAVVPETFSVVQQNNAVLIRAPSLNVRPLNFGPSGPGMFSLQIGVGLPFAHVVRYNGRCYVHNGYHRAYAALRAGASAMPCVFRDVGAPEEVGVGPGTFRLDILEGANPPTMRHYASGQAHPVQLVRKTKTIHLSWTDWVSPEV